MVQRLRAAYGAPKPLPTSDPFELVLWENAVYLLSDERRQKVFDLLRERVGLKARDTLAAQPATLVAIAKLGGMRPEVRVERWLSIARITLVEFQGDLGNAVRLPLKQAKKALQRFPTIGEPGAEKILMLSKSHAVLGLDSNGLRVLVRVGFGREQIPDNSSAAVQPRLPDLATDQRRWTPIRHFTRIRVDLFSSVVAYSCTPNAYRKPFAAISSAGSPNTFSANSYSRSSVV
jgi:endonuclease III